MFMERKTQNGQDVNYSQLDLQGEHELNQNPGLNIDKPLLKFVWRGDRPRVAKQYWREEQSCF